MKARRPALLLAGLAGALAVTGCTPSGNVAAKVGDTTVTTSEVDFLTDMQCASLDASAENQAQGQSQTIPTSQVRTGMLNTLVQAELNRQLAERDDLTYSTETLRGVMQQFQPVLEQVPADDRDRFRDVVEDVYRGQLQVYAHAERQLASAGVDEPAQEQVEEAVAAIQDEFRKSVDVEVNPRYGANANGVAGASDPSLSLPVSSFAKQASSAQPEGDWVSDLPADQRCG